MASKFEKGQTVEIISGEHGGVHARIVALQEVDGEFQYGLSGIPGTNGNLYAVHEMDISIVAESNNQTITPPTIPPEVQVNGTPNNLADQLRQVADLAAQSETETYSKYDMILDRLDEIDKRLEVKEIKVVVEVQHTYNKKEFATYSDEDRLIGYDTERAKATVNKWKRISMLNRDRGKIDKRQLNFLEGEEE